MRIVALLALHVIGVTTLAAAQRGADAAGKGAADAQAPLAPLVHESAFKGYRPFTDASAGSWRGANDEVARIGGWKAYAREVHETATQAVPVERPAASAEPVPAQRTDGSAKP